jgi:hypothetical protein
MGDVFIENLRFAGKHGYIWFVWVLWHCGGGGV